MEIELAATELNHLGEGPVWHQAEQRSTGKTERHDVGRFAISFAFCDDGELLMATDSELAYWSPGSNDAEHIMMGSFDSSTVTVQLLHHMVSQVPISKSGRSCLGLGKRCNTPCPVRMSDARRCPAWGPRWVRQDWGRKWYCGVLLPSERGLPHDRLQLGWGNSAPSTAHPGDMMARTEQVRALDKSCGALVIR
jgi:hypothetical protein